MKRYPLKYKGKIISLGHTDNLHPILIAFRDIKYGLFEYHYPLCCVIQFIIETLKCEPSAYKRRKEYNYIFNGRYVPCNKCLKGKEK